MWSEWVWVVKGNMRIEVADIGRIASRFTSYYSWGVKFRVTIESDGSGNLVTKL